MEKPIFAGRIFWDVDFDQLDYDKRPSFIIERVFIIYFPSGMQHCAGSGVL
jgi:hypothetical protein